jgi:hypothetical protein
MIEEPNSSPRETIRIVRAYVPGRVGTTGQIVLFEDDGQGISIPCEVFRDGDGITLRIYSQKGSADWEFNVAEFADALESARRIAEESDSPP